MTVTDAGRGKLIVSNGDHTHDVTVPREDLAITGSHAVAGKGIMVEHNTLNGEFRTQQTGTVTGGPGSGGILGAIGDSLKPGFTSRPVENPPATSTSVQQ